MAREDSNCSVVESSEESTKARRPSKKYYILHGKCSHSADSYKYLRTMVNNHYLKKKKHFRNYGKSNKELNALIEKKFQKFVKYKNRRKTEKELQHFQEMQISNDESKKSVSSLVKSVESEEISSSSSDWKIGSDELFVTCLNSDSENKIKPIKNDLDLFINTRLNHMSIRSRLVSQTNNNESISNNEQSINSTDLSPITSGVIIPPKLRGKISTNSQINPVTLDENKNSKVLTIKILLDSGASG